MTREEILQAIEDLTAQIRTLSYSSSKEAAAQRADLQQRRRDLRAQLELKFCKVCRSEAQE